MADFYSQNQIGTSAYSKDLANYLNSLSVNELAGLNMDISGLARSDLSTFNPNQFASQYHNDGLDLWNASKYRNIATDFNVSPNWYEYGAAGNYSGMPLPPSEGVVDTTTVDLPWWQTRNAPGAGDYVYRYTAGGGFEPVPYNAPKSDFVRSYFPTAVMAAMGAGAGSLLSTPAALGSAATSTATAGGSTIGSINPSSFSVASGTATGGAGSSTSLLSGAGSLTGTSGSLAGIAPNLASAGVSAGGSLAGTGANALLGSSSLGISPSFSLIEGANSLNLGLADRWALPEELQSLDYSNPWKELAEKALKEGLNRFMSSDKSGNALSPSSYSLIGNNAMDSERSPFKPVATEPWSFNKLKTQNPVLGYSDYLRS